MIECQGLWTCACDDVHVGTHQRVHDHGAEYMNLGGPQYLQIFRTTIRTNADELRDGSWLKKAEEELERHFWAIDEHLNLSHGVVMPNAKDQVVGEGSGPGNAGIRPYRIMHGLASFREKEDFDSEWVAGVLFLRHRMLRLLKPYAPMNGMTGADMEFVREACWLSEVALGFKDDKRWNWEPLGMADMARSWLREAATWEGDDFP